MSFYATNAARIAALYRLPIRAVPSRTLVVQISGSNRCNDEVGLPADAAHLVVSAGQLLSVGLVDPGRQDQHEGAFDLAVLHRALDDIGVGVDSRQRHRLQLLLLQRVWHFLDTGGYVAGCFGAGGAADNRSNPLERFRSAVSEFGSLRSCARLLRDAGFHEEQVFIAVPSTEAPKMLVSSDKATARRLFRQVTVRQSGLRGGIEHAARIALIESGLEFYRHRSLFFWGRKAC